MTYSVKAEILLRINEGDHPNILWSEDFKAEGKPEVVKGVKTHTVVNSDVLHALFCAIQNQLGKVEGQDGSEVDAAYAVSCAEHLIKHYGKKEDA